MARRSGLGKGLGALIPPEVSTGSESILREVPIASIAPSSLQPRSHFDEEAMSSLAASIRELGVLQPVLVRTSEGHEGTSYELIAGERRWRAARRAGLQTIPVLVQDTTSDANSLEQALVENIHREDLNPLEEAAAYQQLIDDFGLTHEQAAKRVGKSRAVVTNTLRLLQLPSGVQRSLADKRITAGHARALLGTPDRALQEQLAKRVVDEQITVRSLEDIIRGGPSITRNPTNESSNTAIEELGRITGSNTPKPSSPGPPRRLPEPGLLELEELLSSHLNTRVKVELQNRRGRVVVEFATLEDLERIYRVMTEGPISQPLETQGGNVAAEQVNFS